MSEQKELLTTHRKALTVNLDGSHYGTIAEIGAGQEVARIFFQAGNASGSIAKTMSAYDMTFSDAIYGKAPRYVSRERLQTMLQHEYALLQERLAEKRADRTCFFVFANTVAAKSARVADGHGWLGIRFQREPLEAPSEVIIHVRMWDKKNVLQQEALGIVGTNLIYGAFHYHAAPERLITSLADNVGVDRVEVDMIKFTGPAFAGVDNRLLALHLVKHGLTNAVMFAPTGEVLQPSEAIYGKAVLVERGSFRPVTRINSDIVRCAEAHFLREPDIAGRKVLVLMEITMNDLAAGGAIDPADFLARVDMLGAIGCTVLISNYHELFRLVGYFRRYTREMVGVALGLNSLLDLFNERRHEHLDGGILESMGRLFKQSVKLYVYPKHPAALARTAAPEILALQPQLAPGELFTVANLRVSPHLRFLYQHLLENRNLEALTGYDTGYLDQNSREVEGHIQRGDPDWENLVAPEVADLIKRRGLLGYPAKTS